MPLFAFYWQLGLFPEIIPLSLHLTTYMYALHAHFLELHTDAEVSWLIQFPTSANSKHSCAFTFADHITVHAEMVRLLN